MVKHALIAAASLLALVLAAELVAGLRLRRRRQRPLGGKGWWL